MKPETGMLIGFLMMAALPLMIVTGWGPLVWIAMAGAVIGAVSFVWSLFED